MIRVGNTIFLSSILGIVSKNDGEEWKTAKLQNNLGDKRELATLASDGKHLIAAGATISNLHINNNSWFASNYMYTYRSQDSCKTWTLAQQGLPSVRISDFKTYNDSLWVCTSAGIYLSLDQGDKWSQFLPSSSNSIGKNSKGEILFTSGQKLLKASFPYVDWDTVTFSKNLTKLVQAGDTMYLSTAGDYLYRSFNGGLTWEKISNGLNTSNGNIYELTINKEFAVTSIENVIYVLRHTSDQWNSFNQALPFGDIRDLMILDNDLYAIVQFQGLFRRSLSDFEGPTSVDQPANEKSSGFYPNPAVEYIYLKNTLNVEQANLYDLSGKLIRSFDGNETLNISGIEKGIFIIRITHKDKTETFERLIKY
jgi:hypothetical protein